MHEPKTIAVPRVENFAELDRMATDTIASVNWPAEWPYAPNVRFRMAHNGERLFVRFEVSEEQIRATKTEPKTAVCEDSCVEMFVSLGEGHPYFNLELNCIGTMLAAHRLERPAKTPLTAEQIALVVRRTSLGGSPIEKAEGGAWWLEMEVPFALLGAEGTPNTLRANLYKCGDKLRTPHYLSWSPIEAAKPDFHRPEQFGTLIIK